MDSTVSAVRKLTPLRRGVGSWIVCLSIFLGCTSARPSRAEPLAATASNGARSDVHLVLGGVIELDMRSRERDSLADKPRDSGVSRVRVVVLAGNPVPPYQPDLSSVRVLLDSTVAISSHGPFAILGSAPEDERTLTVCAFISSDLSVPADLRVVDRADFIKAGPPTHFAIAAVLKPGALYSHMGEKPETQRDLVGKALWVMTALREKELLSDAEAAELLALHVRVYSAMVKGVLTSQQQLVLTEPEQYGFERVRDSTAEILGRK